MMPKENEMATKNSNNGMALPAINTATTTLSEGNNLNDLATHQRDVRTFLEFCHEKDMEVVMRVEYIGRPKN